MSEVRVRIAPSPTGDPHVGTAYIALLNLAFARHHKGKFILRIEDTDQSRSRPIYEENIYKALKWAGLEWDEGPDIGGPYGPYRQSERTSIYQQYAKQLLDRKMAYKCFATSEELEEMRKLSKGGYNRLYRNLSEDEVKKREEAGQKYVVRLKVPLEGQLVFEDQIMGQIRVNYGEIDDQILLKADGFPTYHLANVVDDHLMKITHVLRGSEWLTSTPKHLVLYEAFGFTPPKFYHLPLLLNKDGKKLSKRKNPCSIFYFRDSGYIPEALLNFLSLMGYSMPNDQEIYSVDELIQTFDEKRFGVSGAYFDLQKLEWLNQQYLLKITSLPDLWRSIKAWAFPDEKMLPLMELIQPRIKTYSDFIDLTSFFFTNHLSLTEPLLVPKTVTKEQVILVLQCFIWALDEREDWGKEAIEEASKQIASRFQLHHKKELMPILFGAITARSSGPPLYQSFELIGKDRCRARFLKAIEFLGGLSNKKTEELQSHWVKKDCSSFTKKENGEHLKN